MRGSARTVYGCLRCGPLRELVTTERGQKLHAQFFENIGVGMGESYARANRVTLRDFLAFLKNDISSVLHF